jgi:hypothetical protein
MSVEILVLLHFALALFWQEDIVYKGGSVSADPNIMAEIP